MVPKGKSQSATVCLVTAVIVTCYLAQTIDCYRLTKTERREGRKEADASRTIGVQEGTIVFGRVFEKGSGLQPRVLKSSNASAAEEAAYQADSPGQSYDVSSKDALWKRMAPSLQCGLDQLRFRAVGPGASHFTVEHENTKPMPLYQIPPTCGYSMQRNSLVLALIVPYDGCNMVHEGENYVLPMYWKGIPLSLWCPKPAVTAAPQLWEPHEHQIPHEPQIPYEHQIPHEPQIPYEHQIPHEPQIPYEHQIAHEPQIPHKHQIAHEHQIPFWPIGNMDPNHKFPTSFLPPHPQYPKHPAMPQLPGYPPGFSPFYPYFYPPLPATTAPPTTTPKISFPYYPPHFHPFPWHFPVPLPADPKHQSPKVPPHGHLYPNYNFFPSYQTPKPTTTRATTTKPPVDHPYFHPFAKFYHHSHPI